MRDDLVRLTDSLRSLLGESERVYAGHEASTEQALVKEMYRFSESIREITAETHSAVERMTGSACVKERLSEALPAIVQATDLNCAWNRLIGGALEQLADAISCIEDRGDLTDESVFQLERRWQSDRLWEYLYGERTG